MQRSLYQRAKELWPFGLLILAGIAAVYAVAVFVIGERSSGVGTFLPCSFEGSSGDASVVLGSTLAAPAPGSLLGINASLISPGHPVYDGALYIRVFKDAAGGEPQRLIDGFIATTGIDLVTGGTKHAAFTWRVPADATHSVYRIQGFVASPNQPFIAPATNSVPNGGQVTISVATDATRGVFIDPGNVTVAGAKERSGAPAVFAAHTDTTIEVRAYNDTNIPYEGTITWSLYPRAFSPLAKPLVTTGVVKVHPHSSSTIRYVLKPMSDTSYYLVGRMSKKDMPQAQIDIPLVEKGACVRPLIAVVTSGWGMATMIAILLGIVGAAALALRYVRERYPLHIGRKHRRSEM